MKFIGVAFLTPCIFLLGAIGCKTAISLPEKQPIQEFKSVCPEYEREYNLWISDTALVKSKVLEHFAYNYIPIGMHKTYASDSLCIFEFNRHEFHQTFSSPIESSETDNEIIDTFFNYCCYKKDNAGNSSGFQHSLKVWFEKNNGNMVKYVYLRDGLFPHDEFQLSE